MIEIKVGDYIVNQTLGTAFLPVIAIVGGGTVPKVIGIVLPEHPHHMHWYTEAQIDQDGWVVGLPDFDAFTGLEVGDVISDGGNYFKVLARVGNAALLSAAPDALAAGALKFLDHLQKTHGAHLDIPQEQMKDLRAKTSTIKTQKEAGDWFDVHYMALANWKILDEK